jgi:hypothetical protein
MFIPKNHLFSAIYAIFFLAICLSLILFSNETVFTQKQPKIKAIATPNKKKVDEIKMPDIISRQTWQAKDVILNPKTHEISYITVHHTATKQNVKLSIETKLQRLQNFSQTKSKLASGKEKPAWADIPYHYYIAFDGKIGEGREIKYVGDTNTEYDPTGHALIVLEGNFEVETVTKEQQISLVELTKWLANKYKVPAEKIKVHNDFAKTACPGKNLKDLMPTIIKKIEIK